MATQSIPSPARYSTGFGTILPWSPVLVGVGVVLGYLIWILVVPPGESSSTAPSGLETIPPASAPPESPPAATPGPAPSGTAYPTGSPDPIEWLDPTASPGAIGSPGVSEPPPDPTAAPDDFVGRYRLVAVEEHAFTARVVLVNGSDQPRDWRLELEFPPDVGDLIDIRVEGGPEPEVDEAGNGFVFTGTAPVAPVSWVRLTLDIERSGDDIDPISCTVNGVACG